MIFCFVYQIIFFYSAPPPLVYHLFSPPPKICVHTNLPLSLFCPHTFPSWGCAMLGVLPLPPRSPPLPPCCTFSLPVPQFCRSPTQYLSPPPLPHQLFWCWPCHPSLKFSPYPLLFLFLLWFLALYPDLQWLRKRMYSVCVWPQRYACE